MCKSPERTSTDPRIKVYDNLENRSLPKAWDYNLFREYLLSLARGSNYLLPYNDYPDEISLSETLHDQLNDYRRLSRDGKERWSVLGTNSNGKSLFIQKEPIAGGFFSISAGLIDRAIQKARLDSGIEEIVAHIHSHPTALWSVMLFRLTFPGETPEGFSAGDLYNILQPDNPLPVAILADLGINLIAMRTRDTIEVPSRESGYSQEKFEKEWIKATGGIRVNLGIMDTILPLSSHCQPWSMSQEIAKRHKLVIYAGAPSKSLVKITPQHQQVM